MERVYVATRIEAGLYLQPSNDGQSIFVVASYEDGRANGMERGPWLATYWSWGPITIEEIDEAQHMGNMLEALAFLREKATGYATSYPTKREATEAALASTQSAHTTAGSTA